MVISELKLPLELPLKQGFLAYSLRLKILALIGIINLGIILGFSLAINFNLANFFILLIILLIVFLVLVKDVRTCFSSKLKKVISSKVARYSLTAALGLVIGTVFIPAAINPEETSISEIFTDSAEAGTATLLTSATFEKLKSKKKRE